jgi:uncharacterized phiE125 gp8 family phage protein
MMFKVETQVTEEIISLGAVKDALRITQTDDSENDHLTELIKRARAVGEVLTGYALGEATYKLSGGSWPRMNHIMLPRPPFISLETFTWMDEDFATQTLASSVYLAVEGEPHSKVWLKPDQVWPADVLGPAGWSITYQAGYTDIDEAPQAVTQGIFQLISHWYANREGVVVGSSGLRASEVPYGIREMFDKASIR